MDDKKIISVIRKLAKEECANYDHGYCLETDKPCHVINPHYDSIRDGAVDCDYFLECVLPADWDLNDLTWYAIWYDEDEPMEARPRHCAVCGALFIPETESSRQMYCSVCSEREMRKKHAERSRNYRMRKHT